ncbi:hypothetical protein SLE2022_061440 [Rubroshorea leprosula]
MGEDQSWMYRRRDEMGYWNNEFNAGVEIFLDFAFSQTDPMFCAMNMIRCPCSKCWNREWHHRRRVQSHLITNGFMDGYLIWKRHGEIIHRKRRYTQVGESSSAAATAAMNNVPSVDQLRDMLHDAIGPNFFNNENSATRVEDATQFDARFDDPYGVSTESIFEEPRGDAKEFFDLLRAADTPLFDGCDDGVTVLKWVCKLMSAKTLFNMSVTNWDYVLKRSLMAFKKVDREKLPTDYYSAKKMLRRLGLEYKKKSLHIPKTGVNSGKKPKATYVLSRDQRKSICQWLKQLKFPDGFASNISRCVNTQEVRLFGMKSHDCHIFMQSLIPIAFRDLLPKQVWEPLVEISEFFRALCAPVIQVNDMAIWQERIVEIICKLERIFPPSFFDSMEHLAIHLPYEARVGGPVQFRWMYPFERLMHCLKLTVKNKQRPEASICESYIMSEITNFISHYLDDGVHSIIDNPMRNIVVGFGDNSGLSIFKCVGKRIGSKITRRCLTVEERKAASYYVLMNCEELRGWVSLFESEQCQNMNSQQIQAKQERDLVPWFEQAVISDEFINVHEHIKGLSSGPKNYVSCYNGYIVNGFRFHTAHYGRNKRTMNYGVCVVGSIEADVEEGIGGEDEQGEWEDFETSEEENIETYVEENDSSDE